LCVDVGDVLASQTGSWTLICSHHSHTNLVVDAAPRCELQRGRLLPLAEALKLHRLLKRYLSCAIAVRESFKLTQELKISFAEMYELFDGADGEAWPALPPNAADYMIT
jgi:hypothetical protein